MDYQEIKELLNRYIDGELDQKQAQEIEKEIAQNPLVRLEYEREKRFSQLIKNHTYREDAPFELRESVVKQLGEQKRLPFWPELSSFWTHLSSILFKPAWRWTFTTTLVITLCLGIVFNLNRPFPVFAESVSSHLEYLRGGYPIEIVSDDVEEVKDWFSNKVGFAVNIPDLQARGARLVGARLCHLKDRKVAYMIFEKDGHSVSVFVMDTRGIKVPSSKKTEQTPLTFYAKSTKGFHSILCLNKQYKGTGCIFVSDLPEEKLLELIS